MSDLVKRLEKSTGMDRSLDVDIARACPAEGWRVEKNWSVSAWDGEGWYSMPTEVPSYTHSIDAASSLVPPGHGWTVNSDGTARVWNAEKAFHGLHANGDVSRKPSIALCIAALKARSLS